MNSYRVNLRTTHPTLYRSVIVFALISVGLGLNFWFTRPAFNPYGIDKAVIGSIFMGLGVSKLLTLLVIRNLKLIRLNMAICAGFMMFWGSGTIFSFLSGQTSLQMLVLYGGLAALQLFLLLEPYVNPLTASVVANDGGKKYVDNT